MDKFLLTLIIQNIIVCCMIIFVPVYLLFKSQIDVSFYQYVFLFLFILSLIVISILNYFLILDKKISFGFIRFLPFILMLRKFNSILPSFLGYKFSTYQKYLTIVYLMNRHSILSKESYAHFSKLLPVKNDVLDDDFQEMIESPFWVELHELSDQYAVNRELLAEHGLTIVEQSFAKKNLIFIFFYISLIILIFFKGINILS